MNTNILTSATGLSDRDLLALTLLLLHSSPSALGGCSVQPDRGRPGLPALPGDPRPARLGRCDARRVQALLRREIPDGDPGEIFDRALTLLLETVEKRKLGAAKSSLPHLLIRPRTDRSARNISGFPPRSGTCQAWTGHGREHLATLLAAQPLRGRADLRGLPVSLVKRAASLCFDGACRGQRRVSASAIACSARGAITA
jgi:hypothetical protein